MKTKFITRTLLIWSLAFGFGGLVAFAQETYSVNLNTAGAVAQLDLGRAQKNRDTCTAYTLAPTCTQAQVCVAANVAGGASCTVVDANNAGVRIYANNLAGREAFVALSGVKAKLDEYTLRQGQDSLFAAKTFCASANQTQKDAVCTATGQSAGCGLCDYLK